MEIKQSNKIHPLRNLSLKWSFVLYVAVCILVDLLLSVSLSGFISVRQNNIQNYYHELYKDELAKQAYLVSDGEVVLEGEITIYTEDLRNKFSKRDAILYDIYEVLTIIIVPVVSVLCVLAVGVVFYLRKLKKPLKILDSASMRIAAGDLDFNIAYDSRNEFGRLAASFERMRESLHDTNREMWQMMEARKRLNSAFAHDLRTPLTVLRGYCDFLFKYIPSGKIDNEKVVSTLSTMDVYLKRLEGYTSTMSSLQKLDEIELSPKQIQFTDLCEELKNIANMLIEDKSLNFIGNGCTFLNIDKEAVSQVFENLVSNAVRYAEKEIMIICSNKDEFISVSVSDDGSGFTSEAIKSAAKPYYRDEKDISDAAHFGIGLYICQLLCEKHGGSLLIENAEGGKVTANFASLNDMK